jgi:hypothetical protein
MMTPLSQNKELLNNHSILPKKDPPEGKTTAIIVVMRGKPLVGLLAPSQRYSTIEEEEACRL